MTLASNILDRLFEPFFGWNIAGTYQSASQFIDFVLYLIFFISVTRFALAKRFDAKTQKPITIIVGIVLAIGMSVFGRRWGFSIGDLAPLAGLLFLVVLGMMFFKLIKDMGDSVPGAGAFAFLLIFFSMTAIVPSFYSWIINKVPFLEALLSIGVLLAVFVAVKEMIGLITGGGAKGGAKADEDMGIRDSRDFLEKKARDKEKRRKDLAKAQAEKLRREADEARAKAAAAKTPEEKAVYEKLAEDKKAEVDKKLKEGDSPATIRGHPAASIESSIKEIRERERKYLEDQKKIEKKQLKLISKITKDLNTHEQELNKIILNENEKWDYNKLSDEEKQNYEALEKYCNKELQNLVDALILLENREIKDQNFLKSLKTVVKTEELKDFYNTIIGDDNIIKEKYDLINLTVSLSKALLIGFSKKSHVYHIRGLIIRIIKIIEKLKDLNVVQLKK